MTASTDFENNEPGFQIAPMVDVVFVLMLFFMAFAAMKIAEKELPAQLPGAGKALNPAIVIEIAEDGRVSANERVYGVGDDKALVQLRGWLRDIAGQFGSDEAIIIRPAADATHERIMDVLSAASASGFQRVTFG
jgi:biopolymer transport protein ExbD